MKVRTAPTLFTVALLMDVCAGLVAMAMPLTFKSEFGLTDDWTGALMGTSTFMYMIASIYAGRLADRWGATVSIRIGIAIILVDCLVFSFSQSLILFIICSLGSPLGHAFFWPAFQAWFGKDVDRRETARRVGIFAVGWSIGLNVIGPLMAGVFMEHAARLPFTASWIIALAVFVFFQFLRPELKTHEVHPTQEADDLHPPEIRNKFLLGARVANLMGVYSMVTLKTFVPLVCVDWGLTSSQIGGVVMILGVSLTSAFFVLSLTSRWHYRSLYLFSSQAFGMLGMLAFGIGGYFWLGADASQHARIGLTFAAPAMVFSGIMSGIAFMSCSFYGLFGQEEKGKNSGINESIIGLANMLALYLGGGAVWAMGSMGPYISSGVLMGALLVFQVLALRPKR